MNHTLKIIAFFLLGISTLQAQNEVYTSPSEVKISDTTFVNLRDYSNDFVYDMKYATEDNFLKTKVYDCAECMLRLKTVKALIAANKDFQKKGYKIKLYDCYRPLDIQKKMWEIVSNPIYVADPKKGSIHNRGGAVDISLVDVTGKEVDMGTSFDFFGIMASHNFKQLSKDILSNRKYLKNTMIKNGFNSFDSEWWHYNLKAGLKDKVSNQKWKCD
ncbi:M15 family metallopeptidase [Flavobacterium sp. IB48]|uniref:M15 family metallopeptidase n=1 Tax=Flavobacterium sp. IB48 TaxID=2779375 RepID=UPI0018E892DF|nr:M15 family metallopeptidase [Flavobacterium sp. IB48]MBJ2124941.1 M15 family metallopeptidase [Flavobacterium sp. IB48]